MHYCRCHVCITIRSRNGWNWFYFCFKVIICHSTLPDTRPSRGGFIIGNPYPASLPQCYGKYCYTAFCLFYFKTASLSVSTINHYQVHSILSFSVFVYSLKCHQFTQFFAIQQFKFQSLLTGSSVLSPQPMSCKVPEHATGSEWKSNFGREADSRGTHPLLFLFFISSSVW